MSYRMISGGNGGWEKPVYADEYGNVVSDADVAREKLKEEIKQSVEREAKGDIPEELRFARARKEALEKLYNGKN